MQACPLHPDILAPSLVTRRHAYVTSQPLLATLPSSPLLSLSLVTPQLAHDLQQRRVAEFLLCGLTAFCPGQQHVGWLAHQDHVLASLEDCIRAAQLVLANLLHITEIRWFMVYGVRPLGAREIGEMRLVKEWLR